MEQQPRKKTFTELYEEDQKKKAEAIKTFDIDDFAYKSDETLTILIDNVAVRYKLLSGKETRLLAKKLSEKNITDPAEMGLHVIAEMMHKADSKTTPEKLDMLPGGLGKKILEALGKASGFL